MRFKLLCFLGGGWFEEASFMIFFRLLAFAWLRPPFRLVAVGLYVGASLAASGELFSGVADRERLVGAGDGAELERVVAAAQPGDTIVLGDGVWHDQRLVLNGAGTRDHPIRIRANTPGSVRFTGESSLALRGNDLILDGVYFGDGHLREGAVVRLDGQRLRLMNTVIDRFNPPNPRLGYAWVVLRGQNHVVEQCTFRGKNNAGAVLEVVRSGRPPDHHYIRSSHFLDRASGSGAGWETIRIGRSSGVHVSLYVVVENNLFEGCDGDGLVSSQSGGNTIRRNTIRRSQAPVSLRFGEASLVEANFFFGEDAAIAGGILVAGRGNIIINNYLEAIGAWDRASISVAAGVPGAPVNSYEAADGTVVAFNTIIDPPGPFIDLANAVGSRGRTLLPRDVSIGNNLLYAESYTEGSLLNGEAGPELKLEGNIAYGREMDEGLDDGQIRLADPMMTRGDDGLMRPAPTGPVVAAAVGDYRNVALDIEGQRRSTMKDVGSDEVSSLPVRNRPLTAADVGAFWFYGTYEGAQAGN